MTGLGTSEQVLVERLFEGNQLEDDLRGRRVVETYVIRGLPSGDIESAVFTEAHFPAIGTPHPTIPEAVLTKRQLVGRINQNDVYYALIYRSNLPFGGSRQRFGSAGVSTTRTNMPEWLEIEQASPAELRYELRNTVVERAIATRSIPVQLTDVGIENLINIVGEQLNRVFRLGNINFLFLGASITEAPAGRLEVVYRFQTKGSLPGAVGGTLATGSDGSISSLGAPPLGPLDEWETVPPIAGLAPSTKIRPAEELYLPSDLAELPGVL